MAATPTNTTLSAPGALVSGLHFLVIVGGRPLSHNDGARKRREVRVTITRWSGVQDPRAGKPT